MRLVQKKVGKSSKNPKWRLLTNRPIDTFDLGRRSPASRRNSMSGMTTPPLITPNLSLKYGP